VIGKKSKDVKLLANNGLNVFTTERKTAAPELEAGRVGSSAMENATTSEPLNLEKSTSLTEGSELIRKSFEESKDEVVIDVPQVRYTGIVAKFNTKLGYGYITPCNDKIAQDEGQEEEMLLVHKRDLVCVGFKTLTAGRAVSFYRSKNEEDRLVALDVRSIKGTPISNTFNMHTESWDGRKPTLEDRYCREEIEGVGAYFGLFDGHGGTQCVDFAQKNLHKRITGALFTNKQAAGGAVSESVLNQAIVDGFSETDSNFLQQARRQDNKSGSTALVAQFCGAGPGALRLHMVNLGDCRALLCRGGKALRLSEDHKPGRKDERLRIQQQGGIVTQVSGIWRVARDVATERERRTRILLAVSRAFGDITLKEPSPLVSCTPEIRVETIGDDDLYLIMACDGVFDVLEDQAVIDLANEHWGDPQAAASAVVRTAFQKGSEDNLTAMVIQFGWQQERGDMVVEAWKKAEADRAREASELNEEIDMFNW